MKREMTIFGELRDLRAAFSQTGLVEVIQWSENGI